MADNKFKRKLLTLGVLIAVLAATYVLGLVFSPARIEKRRADVPVLPRLDAEAVASIRISNSEGSVEMTKKEAGWRLALGGRDYPGSASRVKVLLEFLSQVKRTRVATGNPELWKDFGVGSDSSRRVVLRDQSGGTLVELVIGNPEMSLSGDYVRVEGGNEVVLSDRSFSYHTGTDPRFWSELRILPAGLRGQDIVRFTVDAQLLFGAGGDEAGEAAGAPRYTLLLSDEKGGVWVVEGQPAVMLDGTAIDRLMNDLAGIEANEFAAGVSPAEAGLAKPRAQILISTAAGRDYRLLFGDPTGEKQHYVSLEGGDYLYRVAEWRLQGVVKSLKELTAKPVE